MENKFRKEVNYYKILQVDPEANPLVIKNSYYTILNQLKCHPDKGGDEEYAKLINEAYRILSSETLREKYDLFLQKSGKKDRDEIDIKRRDRGFDHIMEEQPQHRRKRGSFLDDFFSMGSDLEHFFGSFFGSTGNAGENDSHASRFPPANICKRGKNFIIKLEVPGICWEDIHIQVEGNNLTVSGERKIEFENCMQVEFYSGPFLRTFQLPSQPEQNKIKAALKDGILEIIIPLKEKKKGQRIPIVDG